MNPQRLCHPYKEFVGNLCQDADAVTGLSFCVLTCPVLQIFHNLKCIFYCGMAFLSFDIDTGADTAVVMFKFRTVKRCFGDCIFYIKHSFTPFLPYSQNKKKVAKSPCYRTLLCDLCYHYTPFLSRCKQLFSWNCQIIRQFLPLFSFCFYIVLFLFSYKLFRYNSAANFLRFHTPAFQA